MKVIWNNTIIAESNNTIVIEGNHYFPPSSINQEFFQSSSHQTTCPWKGLASYYTVNVAGKVNENAAWYYPSPKADASEIKGYVAFWKGITVSP